MGQDAQADPSTTQLCGNASRTAAIVDQLKQTGFADTLKD